jgi:molybdopterin-guanine dinucleotide biosynthesis protein
LQRCKGIDLVFLEGFKKLVGKNHDIPKIVTVKSAEDTVKALKTFKPILVFAGLHSIETLNSNIPYMNIHENAQRIADMVEKNVRRR